MHSQVCKACQVSQPAGAPHNSAPSMHNRQLLELRGPSAVCMARCATAPALQPTGALVAPAPIMQPTRCRHKMCTNLNRRPPESCSMHQHAGASGEQPNTNCHSKVVCITSAPTRGNTRQSNDGALTFPTHLQAHDGVSTLLTHLQAYKQGWFNVFSWQQTCMSRSNSGQWAH